MNLVPVILEIGTSQENIPTPGGNKVVNKAFINFVEGKNVRAY